MADQPTQPVDAVAPARLPGLRWMRGGLFVLGAVALLTAMVSMIVLVLPTQSVEERLVEAVSHGDDQTVATILARDSQWVKWRDRLDVTLLHRAARDGHTAIVDLLLQHGADPRARALAIETTPLHLAAGRGRVAVIEQLLAVGVPVDIAAKDGSTPLHTAAHKGEPAAVALLLKRGAQVNHRTDAGLTPLHAACVSGRIAAVDTLLEAGALLEARTNDESFTPLHVAIFGRRYAMIGRLLQEPVDLTLRDTRGRTAMDLARDTGDAEIIKRLEAALQPQP